jgi:hypothetical protein
LVPFVDGQVAVVQDDRSADALPATRGELGIDPVWTVSASRKGSTRRDAAGFAGKGAGCGIGKHVLIVAPVEVPRRPSTLPVDGRATNLDAEVESWLNVSIKIVAVSGSRELSGSPSAGPGPGG